MRPYSLHPALLFLVELKRLRLNTLTGSSPRHGRAERVSDSCLPINQGSVAVEGYDPGWFQAISPPLAVYSYLLIVSSSSEISADCRDWGTAMASCLGSFLRNLPHSRIAMRA